MNDESNVDPEPGISEAEAKKRLAEINRSRQALDRQEVRIGRTIPDGWHRVSYVGTIKPGELRVFVGDYGTFLVWKHPEQMPEVGQFVKTEFDQIVEVGW